MIPAEVASALRNVRFTASNETRLQEAIASILDGAFPGAFAREHILSRRDRPDFFAQTQGIVVEAKWGRAGGSPTKVVAQLARYAEHPGVRAIVFVTPSRRVASGVPDVVGGIPVTHVVLTTGL